MDSITNEDFDLEIAVTLTQLSASSVEDDNPVHVSTREQGRGYYKLAKVYYDKADFLNAEKYFQAALTSCEVPQDIFALFKIYGFLIRIASEKMQQELAQSYIVKASKLIDEAATFLGTLTCEYFYNVGVIHTYKGQTIEARRNFELAIKKAKEENEPAILAKSIYALSKGFFQEKKLVEAEEWLGQLHDLLEILQKKYLIGTMNLLQGNILIDLGQYDKALDCLKNATLMLREKHCWNLYGYALLAKGITYKSLGDFARALTYFNLALDTTDASAFKRLHNLIQTEILDVNDSSVDLYLDRTNRLVQEKTLGTIDFKHRFVLLEILFLLARHPGRYYEKEDLAKSIWKDEYNPLIHDKLIYTSVSRLRKLVEPKTEKRKYILRGKDGYTFNPHVKIRFHKEGLQNTQEAIGNVEISSPV